MKKYYFFLIVLGSLFTLTACSTKKDSTDLKTTQHIAAVNQSVAKENSDKAADSSARTHNGPHWQATNDHIVSADEASSAIKATIETARKLKIVAIQNANVDSQGHHYYQVDTFQPNTNSKHVNPVATYFVYPDGQITTKHTN